MKKSMRTLCLAMAVLVFALFALGSGSEPATETGSDTATVKSGDNDVGTTAASGKAEYTVGDAAIEIYTNSIGSRYVMVSWSVTNTGNVDVYLGSGSADIENSSGTIEDTVSYIDGFPSVLKPGEKGYYYENTLYDGSATTGLKMIPHAEVEKASAKYIRYDVSEISIKDEQYWGAKVVGRVENNTEEAADSVKVAALLFDSNKKLLSIEYTYLDGTLGAGDKKAFEISSFDYELAASDIASYTVYAYPTQFNW